VEHVLARDEEEQRTVQMTMNSLVRDGKVTGLVIILYDVTEMKRSDRERRVILKAITESPASVVITDVTGSITYVNPKFTEVTGYTDDEAMGKNPSILKSGMQDREFYSRLWETILSGNEWRGEFHNRKKNGELYWEQASISPIINDDGDISHFVAVKEDITEAKRKEFALRESEKKLRDHNEQMLHDLQQAREIIDRLYPMDVPVMPGISLATRFIPMELVGGDFYTWYSSEPGIITFLMGDVAGHGVPAALFLSLVRSLSDRLMPVHGKHPARLLEHLNRELIGSLSSYFLTAVALTLEIREDRSGAILRLASGGHPPVMLMRNSADSMEYLNPSGRLLGILEDIEFYEESHECMPGDRIYLYTDGLIEVMNREKQLINLDGASSMILDSPGVTLDESLDNLLVSLERYREGMPYGDDLLLIGIEIDKGTGYVE
jgi:PAS domain S-box-containing protein